MPDMTIDVVSDAVCPWCFVGKRRLEAALAESGGADIAVQWRPFQLDPTIPAEGLDRQAYMRAKFRDDARLAEVHQRLKALGAEVGLTEISMRTYGTELPIEVVLATSFPPEGMLDHVRSLVRRDAESGLDAFGMNARLKDGAVWATYPMTVVVWARYPHKETAADRGDQRPELEVSLKPPA